MRGNELLQALVGFGVLNFWITAALGLAWIMARMFRKHAAMRHLIRLSALMMLPALPVLAHLSPPHYPLRVPLPAPLSNVARSFVAPKKAVHSTDRTNRPSAEAGSDQKPTHHRQGRATNWRLMGISLVSLWAAGALLFALQPFIALWGLRKLYRDSEPGHLARFNRSALENHVRPKRAWELRFGKATAPATAMTWGFIKPIILLPREAAQWSEDRRQAVLLHELAHVQRADSLTQILTYCVCALYWFHPGVWLTAGAMRQDAEAAADDAVLRSGVRPSVYAYELMQMAKQSSARPAYSGSVGVAFLRHSKIETRIRAIVDRELERRSVGWRGVQLVLALSVMIALATAVLRPSVTVRVRAEKPHYVSASGRLVRG